jgi:hypothetical protein
MRQRPATAGAGVRAAGARWLLCFLLVVSFTAAPALGQRQPHIGYVYELRGDWVSEDGTKLFKSSRLQAGERVHVRSPTSDDFIVIVNKTNSVIGRRSCNRADECAHPLVVWQVVVESVWDLLFGERGEVIVIRSREGPELLDGVAELRGGRVNLSTSFQRLPAGVYYLSMQSVGRPGTAAAEGNGVGVRKINWGPKSPPVMSGRGLRPGLYELALHLQAGDGDTIPTGATAWVLLSKSKTFRNNTAAQQEAQALTDSWGNTVSTESKRDFLRAHLAHLAGWGTQ